MLNTIRLFACSYYIEKYDEYIKSILSNKFNVLSSQEIYGDTYELAEEYVDGLYVTPIPELTDFAILIMDEIFTSREPMINWFDKMIHPVIDYANFTHIIIHTFNHNYEYIQHNNINIKYVPWKNYHELSDEIIQILKELSL